MAKTNKMRNKKKREETLLSPACSSSKINKTATGKLQAANIRKIAAVCLGVAAAVSSFKLRLLFGMLDRRLVPLCAFEHQWS